MRQTIRHRRFGPVVSVMGLLIAGTMSAAQAQT